MAEPDYRVELTASFLARLRRLRAFGTFKLVDASAGRRAHQKVAAAVACAEFCHLKSCNSSLEPWMGLSASDVIPFTQARATLSELANQVKAGAEKIITKNGASYVALIDADRLDYYHRLERERIHLLLLDEAEKGLADVAAGRTRVARQVLRKLKAKRAA